MTARGPEPTPTVTRTRWLSVLLATAVGAALALVAVIVLERTLPGPPSPGPAGIWIALLALVTSWCAVLARRRIQRNREPVEPPVATSWLALAKTGLLIGGLFAGAFAAYALASIGHVDTPAGRPRVWLSAVAALASVGWVVAGRWLERSCLVPPDSDDDPSPGQGA